MSLADVFVRVRPDTKGFGSELKRGVGQGADEAGRHAGRHFSSGWGGAIKGIAAATAGVFAAVEVKNFFKDSIAGAREAARVTKLTNAVLTSTGGAAHVSAKQVDELARSMSKKTGIDHVAIQGGENLLLTFTRIRNETGKGNDIFNQATLAVQNMSTALGQDTKSSAIQLGKALQDPVKGVTALRRVGVMLTDAQKAQIKAFVESGDTMSAQKVILGELTKEFGGAAEKAAGPAAKAKVAWKDFKEEVGTKLLPVVNRLSDWFTKTAIPAAQALFDFLVSGNITDKLAKVFGVDKNSGFLTFLVKARDAVKGLVGWLADHKKDVATFGAAFLGISAAFAIVAAAFAINPFTLIVLAIAGVVTGILHLWRTNERFRDFIKVSWQNIQESWRQAKDFWATTVENFKTNLAALKARWEAIFTFIDKTKAWFSNLKDHIGRAWEGIKSAFREGVRVVVMWFLNMVGIVLHGAVKLFSWTGWVPEKLKKAAKEFDKFKDNVNKSLSEVKDKAIKVTAAFTSNAVAAGSSRRVRWATEIRGAMGGPVRGGEPGQDSVPYLLMPGEFIVRADGSNLVDAMYHYAAPGMAAGGLIPRFRRPGAGQIDRVATNAWRETGGRIGRQLLQDLINTMGTGGGYGSGVSRWSGIVLQVLSMLGQSAAWLGTVLSRMQRESGGNPYAINLWDINAQRGDPSRGLMQTIMGTFLAYAGPFRGLGIYNPLANVYAGLNYALHRYGTLAALSRPGGYDNGGWLPTGMSLAINNTGRPERVLSPSEQLGGRTYIINQHLVPGVHPAEVGRQTVLAIQAFERGNGSEWRDR